MEKEVTLKKQFKPIVEPLKRIVEHTGRKDIVESPNDGDETRHKDSDDEIAPSPIPGRFKKRRLGATSNSPLPSTPIASTPIKPSIVRPIEEEEVFETRNGDLPPSFGTSVRQILRMSQGREALHSQLGPLG